MKNILLIISLFILIIQLNAQELMKISEESIFLDEFVNTLMKNNNDKEITKEYLDDYLDLFINYKLKVIEAKKLGLHKEKSFISELEMYRKQLAKPYLQAKEFKEELIYEAYDRKKYDVDISHILFKFNDEGIIDTLKYYNIAKEAESRIQSGEISFEEAITQYSDATYNNGHLGYFTAFDMVYNFETAAYTTKVGDFSPIIRTKYGYHLLQVNNKRPAVGKVKSSHIMLRIPKGATSEQIDKIRLKIDEVYKKLNNGEDFANLADRYSEDRSTAVKGGSLPWIGVFNRYTKSFTNPIFALKDIGDYSAPFLSENGWHIVILNDKKELGTLEEEYNEIKEQILKDKERSILSEVALLRQIKKEYNFINHKYNRYRKESVKNDINHEKLVKSTLDFDDIRSSSNDRTLFYLDGIAFTQNNFKDFILENQDEGIDFDVLYDRFVDFTCLSHKESKLEQEEPEYKSLLNEFRDGILLFEITSNRVWTKAMEDSIGLRDFFDSRPEVYWWGERVEANIYTCANSQVIFKLRRMLWKKSKDMITIEEIESIINKDSPLNLEIKSGKFLKEENQYVDEVEWKKGIYVVDTDDDHIILVEIIDVLSPTRKELNETRGKVISDYQNYLDENWISELRSQYSIEVNTEILYSIIK